MKKIYLLLAVFGTVTMQAQILPNQTPEKQPEGTDAIYTQEAGQLNKILLDSAFNFFIPRIKQTALSYSITTTNNPDSLRGYFVLDNTATWYYIDSASYAVALGGGGGGTTQLLSFTSPNLSISGGNTVDISAIQDGTGTDDQTLTLAGNTLSIESGNSVDLSGYLDNTDDQTITTFTLSGTQLLLAIENGPGTYTTSLGSLLQDANEVPVTAVGNLTSTDVQAALQELQTDIDAITGGAGDGVITAASYDGVDEQIDVTVAAPGTSFSFDVSALTKLTEAEVDAFVANNGYLTSYTETDPVYSAAPASGITSLNITNWNTAYGWGDHSTQGYLTSEVDGSVTNEIQDLSLTGTTLSLTGDATTVDLSVIQDGTGTDDQTAAEVAVTPVGNLNSTNVQAALQEHQADIDAISAGAGDGVATAGAYNAGTGNIDITVAAPGSSFSFDVTALEPLTESEVDAFVANNGYLTAEVDGSTTNEIQDLSLTGNTLSLTNDATTVDLSGYLDNTDDQTIDVFAFDGTNLTLSLEGDGEATKSIDLSSLSTNTTYDFIQLNTAFVNTDFSIGEIGWSENDEVRIGILDNYDFAVGQDIYKSVHNTTADAIPAGTALKMTGADGNSGIFTVAPIDYPATGAEYFVGIAAVAIPAGSVGVAVQNGNVRGINTSIYSLGQVLYLDEVNAGGLTTTPGGVIAAAVTSVGTNGSIYVRPDFYAGLSQAESDAVGAMVSGNTETLIDVTYQADNTIDFVVNNDLSLYDNTTSGFLMDADFGTAGLMATDGAGTYSIVTDNSTNWNTAYSWGDHATQGYLTTEVDGSITNEIQDLSLSVNTLSLTGDATTVDLSGYLDNTDNQSLTYNVSTKLLSLTNGGNVDLSGLAQSIGISGYELAITGVSTGYAVPIINTVENSTAGSASVGTDLQGAYNRIVQIDMTSAGSSFTLLTPVNPVSGGVYTFHFQNTTNHDIGFPATFLKADGTTWDGGSTVNYTADFWMTCYYDGTDSVYYCK